MSEDGGLIELRSLLRAESIGDDATVIVRGGRDTVNKLRTHALRTARAWSFDGQPLFGISVFAALDVSPTALLRARFATFRTVHLTTAGLLRDQFELLATGRSPHFTVRLASADDAELSELLSVLGPPRDNPEYGHFEPTEEVR